MIAKLKELRKNEEGFTLIELMVVVLIIGILAAIAIPVFLNLQKEGIKASVKSDVKNTVTNVATFLASTPQGDPTDLNDAAAPAPAVVETKGNTVAVSGDWDSYVVHGTGTGVDAWGYGFISATGAYDDTNGTAPTAP